MVAYDSTNVFARILRGEIPSQRVFEDDRTVVIMDIMPRGPGHVLVLPRADFRNMLDVDDETIAAVARTTRRMAVAVREAFGADGVTIQQFNESAGGQVVFHLHVHVIPRFDGVPMRPHTGEMEASEVLAANAAKIRAAL
jgi:histidine triad (HIT) family protein